MTKVFAVLNKYVIYADFGCYQGAYANDDPKDFLLSDNPSLEAIFSTRQKAEAFIHKTLVSRAKEDDEDNPKAYIKHQKDFHWSIDEHEIDKAEADREGDT